MKLLLNHTLIDVGMIFGIRIAHQWQGQGGLTRRSGDGGEQLLPVLKEDEIVDDLKRDDESAAVLISGIHFNFHVSP